MDASEWTAQPGGGATRRPKQGTGSTDSNAHPEAEQGRHHQPDEDAGYAVEAPVLDRSKVHRARAGVEDGGPDESCFTRAWLEPHGRFRRHAVMFQTIAPVSPAPITVTESAGFTVTSLPIGVGHGGAQEERTQEVEDRGQDDRREPVW